jgi:hypothetical protein
MAKRTAYLHIGPTHSGSDLLADALALHALRLAEQGVHQPAKSRDEMLRAAIEIRRVHKAWGYKRSEVEGAWSAICRRAHKSKGTVLVSQPHLAAATHDEIALLLDQLPGFDVHVVVNLLGPPAPDGDEDAVAIIHRWAGALRSPDRMHVVVPPRGSDPVAFTWATLGEIVGFDAPRLVPSGEASLRGAVAPARRDAVVDLAERWGKAIADGGYDVHGDLTDLLPVQPGHAPAAGPSTDERLLAATRDLTAAYDELERLRVRAGALEARNAALTRKGKKLKRRLGGRARLSA